LLILERSNRPWKTRTHCCGHIVAHDVSRAAQTGKHLLRTQKVSESETFFVFRTQNLCPQQMLRAGANGEAFVSATMCPQQCVLVCQGFIANTQNTTGIGHLEYFHYSSRRIISAYIELTCPN